MSRIGSNRVAAALVLFGLLFSFPLLARGSEVSGRIDSDAQSLVLQRRDLPGAFAIAGGDDQPDGSYLAMFMRPEVLSAQVLPRGALLGVMANVRVLAGTPAAVESFAQDHDAGALQQPMNRGPLSSIEEIDQPLPGADEQLMFRVRYELAGTRMIEYRYRLRVANAVANLVISGRVGDDDSEPPGLFDQSRALAEKQLEHLLAATR